MAVGLTKIENALASPNPIWQHGRRLVHALGGGLSRAMRPIKSAARVGFLSDWRIDPQYSWLFPPWPGASFPCYEPPDTSSADGEADISAIRSHQSKSANATR